MDEHPRDRLAREPSDVDVVTWLKLEAPLLTLDAQQSSSPATGQTLTRGRRRSRQPRARSLRIEAPAPPPASTGSSSTSRRPRDRGFGQPIVNRRNKMTLGPVGGAGAKRRSRSFPGVSSEVTDATQKIVDCRYFEAAEGTRTLDLLHGKQTHMVRSGALSSCKRPGFHGLATPVDAPRYVRFRRSCVNQSSTRSLTRRTPLRRTRCSHHTRTLRAPAPASC
jgi:hypothetical protein